MTDTAPTPPVRYQRGLLPFDPEKHARFATAAELDSAFTWPTVEYPLDKSGGITDFGMGGNGPDPTLTVNGGRPMGNCGPNAVPKNANQATARVLGEAYTALTSNQVSRLYFIYQAEQAGSDWRPPSGEEWTPPDGLDVGVDLGDWLLWLFGHDENGNTVPAGRGQVEGFVKLTEDELDSALQAGFAVVMGVILTPDADQQFPGTWSVGPGNEPDPNEGHAIERLGAVSPTGHKMYATWGGVQLGEDAWERACFREAFAVFTVEQGQAVGFPVEATIAALKALGGTAEPDPTPAPTPPVVPDPVPPVAPPAPPAPGGDGPIAELESLAHEAISALVHFVEKWGGQVPEWTGTRKGDPVDVPDLSTLASPAEPIRLSIEDPA